MEPKDYEQWSKLFPYEYRQGYTKALLDVLSYFESYGFQQDLRTHKRKQTLKELSKFLRCMLENRIALQENPDAFIRCNNEAKDGYELWYNGKRG